MLGAGQSPVNPAAGKRPTRRLDCVLLPGYPPYCDMYCDTVPETPPTLPTQ
eukprot:COSAG02_NODE_786_length_17199_cov_25.278889_1_plen_51_part_00